MASITNDMEDLTQRDDEVSGGAGGGGAGEGGGEGGRGDNYDTEEQEEEEDVSLKTILNVLNDFRRDNTQQLHGIKQELSKTNTRMEEAESRIDECETVLQAATTLITRLLKRQTDMEEKMIDAEARARRVNIRIYSIPEKSEGENMMSFVEQLLKTSLGFSPDTALGLERCHRALTKMSTDPNAKPRSIVVRFASYRMKEEVISRAWGKKQVFHNNTRYYVDHDYPPAILKKRLEYYGAKKVLQREKIKFQTPYPARMKVFYSDETRMYQTATEATEDMVARGLQVDIVPAATDPDQREIQRLSTWKVAGKKRNGSSVSSNAAKKPSTGMAKLQNFRRGPAAPSTGSNK